MLQSHYVFSSALTFGLIDIWKEEWRQYFRSNELNQKFKRCILSVTIVNSTFFFNLYFWSEYMRKVLNTREQYNFFIKELCYLFERSYKALYFTKSSP